MMRWPKISIITPSYNQGEFLEETICSVLQQNYSNLEYIIIDGGSKDQSLEIIKKYEKYLTFWVSEKDNGHGHALNKGFRKSTGEIMAWLNSDDKYKLGTLKAIAEIFTEFNDVNWVVGKNGWWNKDGDFTYEKYVYKNIYDFLLGNYKWIQQESTFWRRSLWNLAGNYINEDYKLMVDGELWSRFFIYADLWHVNQVFGGYRVHETNRAKYYLNEVNQEMERAIQVLKKKLVNNENIRHIISRINDQNDIYLNDISLWYNIIDHNHKGCWEKKQVNYFAVNFKEQFTGFQQNNEHLNIRLSNLIKKTLKKILTCSRRRFI